VELGRILVNNLPGKEAAIGTRTGKRGPGEVDVTPARIGSVVGHHQVHLAPNMEIGYGEKLVLTHDGYNRDIFGNGALIAVRWVYANKGKDPGLYTFRHGVLGL
jgi:dihydrodipicolinate reductase